MKKLLYILIAILSFTLFGCENNIDTNTPVLNVDSISISDEHNGIEISLNLNQQKLKMEYDDIKYYGIIYEIGDGVMIDQLVIDEDSSVVESETLSIILNNIDSDDYNRTFYFRTYFVYMVEGGDDVVVYSDEILDFNIYDMAQKSDSSFATEVKFFIENEAISEISIETNIEEYAVTSTSLTYDAVLYRYEDNIYITVTPKTGYRLLNQVSLVINDELVNASKFTIFDQTLTYIFRNPNTIDPETYVDVTVTFDLDGGFWSSSIFDAFTPESKLPITTLNDTSGITFTLVDHSVTSIRWFYKLFIKYNETYDAYQVVYTDHATAAISDLTLPDYDYVLAAHDNCSNANVTSIISNYSEGLDEDLYIIFDTDVSIYTSGTIVTSFYSHDGTSDLYNIRMNEAENLPIPFKPEFTFVGWSDGERLFNIFPRYQVKDSTLQITYTAIWEAEVLSNVELYLANLIPDELLGNISLPRTYSAYSISWVSSNPEILSNVGIYNRPYQATTVSLSATIQSGQQTLTVIYNIEVAGYKSLSAPLTSSYIYRDYHLVTDSFFTTLDIINCAFITANSAGTLLGTSVLSNINNYIMPKARENGNWVIFSVAPDSEWSGIASNSTSINMFADNIVAMINAYGFDGVDIDWETPTTKEATSFTEMMRVIYTKVKENNPNHLVTAAIAGGMWQPPRYDLVNSHQYLDYINMMTYGMVNNNGYYQNALSKSMTFANTTNSAGKTLTSCSIEESIDIYHTYGIPNSKIIVGVAFYGIKQTRSYDSASQTWSNWVNAGSVSFNYIINNYINNSSYNSYYDSIAGVPYIIKADGTAFISYDNPRSIAVKSAYIIENGLAGMMYWENGLDQTGTLLLAMEEGLKQID